MTHKERFFATIHHQPVDRPASWLGLPVPSSETALMDYFGVKSIDQLRNGTLKEFIPHNGMKVSTIVRNWIWSALAGTLWAMQFFFYGLGHVN